MSELFVEEIHVAARKPQHEIIQIRKKNKRHFILFVRFQVLKAASMKMTDFWLMAPSSLIKTGRYLRSIYCLHH
jgi:hypothetical protein